MSDYVKGIVWTSPSITKHTDLIVMLAIADASDDSGEAVPTVEELAVKTRLTQRGVYMIRERLKKQGLLKWSDTRIKDSPRCVYSLQIKALTLTLSQGDHPERHSGCPPTTLNDIQGDHPERHSGSYIVYNNTPSKEIDTKDGIGTLATASGSARAQKLTLVTDSSPQKPTSTAARKRFDPPSTESVKAYAAQNGMRDLAEPFIDYYEANGWVQGKAMKPLKSWEAAYRQWCRREVEFKKASGHDVSGPVQQFGSGYKLQPFK